MDTNTITAPVGFIPDTVGETPQGFIADIDLSRPKLDNADGSFSTEKTITIGADNKYYLLPTIVNGKRLSNDDAIAQWRGGKNPPVGTFTNEDEANQYAVKRSAQIGQLRGVPQGFIPDNTIASPSLVPEQNMTLGEPIDYPSKMTPSVSSPLVNMTPEARERLYQEADQPLVSAQRLQSLNPIGHGLAQLTPFTKGAEQGVAEFISGLTTPSNIHLAGLTAGVGEAPVIGRLALAPFAAMGAKGAADAAGDLSVNYRNPEQAGKDVASLGVNTLMGLASARGMGKGTSEGLGGLLVGEPKGFIPDERPGIGGGVKRAVEANAQKGNVNPGGGESELSPEDRAKSRTANSPQAWGSFGGLNKQAVPVEPRYSPEYVKSEEEKRAGLMLSGPVAIQKDSGFPVDKAVEGKQVMGRLENLAMKGVVSPTELEGYKSAGLGEFLSTPKTPKEVSQWMLDNGPRVKVKKFGEGAQSLEQKEYAQLTHHFETEYGITPTRIGDKYFIDSEGTYVPDEEMLKAKRYFELRDKNQYDVSGGESHWQSISPKSNMPGYVEVAVTKPIKRVMAEEGSPEWKRGEDFNDTPQFPSSHSFPPNTLVFGRGYMETVKNPGLKLKSGEYIAPGSQVFHVIEVQSDWAQRLRETQDEPRQNEFKHLQDPLLKDYERLGLKALIEHARKEGADAIAISDAETAMMTEGHDRAARETQWHVINKESGESVDAYNNYKDAHEASNINPQKYTVEKRINIDQEKGMRLHYDQTLPKIAKELTGSEGEKVGFGNHHMAFDNIHDPEGERNPRQDLIFRNPDGTPKTDATARMYKLPKKEEPFTLYGKDRIKPPTKGGIGGAAQRAIERNKEAGMSNLHTVVQDVIKKVYDSMDEMSEKIGNHLKTRDVREAITYSKDAADSQAKLFARNAKNSVDNGLQGFKDKNKAAEALTFVVEAKFDPRNLEQMKRTLENSNKADPTWRNKALNLIDYAKQNFSQFVNVGRMYKDYTDSQVTREQTMGYDTPKRDGYVFHSQDVDDSLGFFKSGFEGGGSFKKMRTYETYADSIANGVKPDTLNALDLLESRLSRGQKMVNDKMWVDSFRTTVDPVTGEALIKDNEIKTRPDGSSYVETPFGYTKEFLGNQVVAVHNGYEGLFSALTDPSWWSKSVARRGVQELNAGAKSIRLAVDTFHLSRVGFWNGVSRALGIKTFKAPLPWKYKQGLTLLDYNEATVKDMVKRGDLPKDYLTTFTKDKATLNLLVNNGFNVGRITDALHEEWMQKVPVVGKFNKFLFDSFQRGAMTEIGLLEFERQKGMNPDWTDKQVARAVAEDVNIRFGNLGRQGIFKSRTAQDTARLITFAPQWNESLIRSELGAVGQGGKFVYNAVTGKKIASGLLMRSVGGLLVAQFAANQLINMYTRGHPTWDNEEEGIGAKLSAWIPDKVGSSSGFFLHPAGLAAETVHLITTRWEKSGSLRKAIQDYVKGRESSLDQLVQSLWTGDWKNAAPMPIPTKAVVSVVDKVEGKPLKEEYPGAVQRQLMSSAGVKTDLAPSGEQRLYSLADKFVKDYGFARKEPPVSPYRDVNKALREGNDKEFLQELDKLSEASPSTYTKQHFIKYYIEDFQKENFTHINHLVENRFIATLTPEQKGLYDKAKQERLVLKQKALRLIRGKGTFRGFEP